jgi:hypothetical protein
MVDCKVKSCAYVSIGPSPVGSDGHWLHFSKVADDAGAEMPVKFQLALPKGMDLRVATYKILSPAGALLFEAQLSIEHKGSPTPQLKLPKHIRGEASNYFGKGSFVLVSVQTDKEIVADVSIRMQFEPANANPDSQSNPFDYMDLCLVRSGGPPIGPPHCPPSYFISTNSSVGRDGTPPGPPGHRPLEHVFATVTDDAAVEAGIPIKFQFTWLTPSPKTMNLRVATYKILSPAGALLFEAQLAIEHNGSATPELKLPKEKRGEASKYFVKGSIVVVSFQTEKKIEPGSLEVLAGSEHAKF